MVRTYIKKTALIILIISLLLQASLALAQNPSLDIFIDGVKQNYVFSPVIERGTVLVPMRPLWESLGATVGWNEKNRSVRATKGETAVDIIIDSLYVRVNGELGSLAVAPKIIDGTTMVPLRFVSEALNARVEWIQEVYQVRIYTDNDHERDPIQGDPIEENILAYEDAVRLALRNSIELRNARQSIIQAEEIRNQLADLRGIGYLPVGPGLTDADAADRQLLFQFVQADVAWQMAKRQVEILEKGLAFQIRKAYDEVLQKEGNLEVAQLAVAITESQLHQERKKMEQGMSSLFALQNAQRALQEEKLNKEILMEELDESHFKLNRLLGLEEKQRLAEVAILLEAENTDVEHQILLALRNNPHIWFQEQVIWLTQLELELYTYNIGATPYAVKEIDVAKEENNLAVLKRDTEETVRSLYFQLEELKNRQALMETALVRAENLLKIVRIQHTLGMVTHTDILEAELSVAQLKNQQRSLALSYNQLQILFKNPWVMQF